VLPIGSHSTLYGLAYTGGLPALAAFCFALFITAAALTWRLMQLADSDPRRSRVLVGLGLTLSLATFCRYETLSNLTLPCLFLFTWIGACLGGNPPRSGRSGRNFAAGRRSARFSMVDRV
jgi:hypothetical protein